jgi:hypothetical protein
MDRKGNDVSVELKHLHQKWEKFKYLSLNHLELKLVTVNSTFLQSTIVAKKQVAFSFDLFTGKWIAWTLFLQCHCWFCAPSHPKGVCHESGDEPSGGALGRQFHFTLTPTLSSQSSVSHNQLPRAEQFSLGLSQAQRRLIQFGLHFWRRTKDAPRGQAESHFRPVLFLCAGARD